MFTTKDFPDRSFATINEYKEAVKRRELVEKSLELKAKSSPVQVMATIIPLPRETVESRVAALEAEIAALQRQVLNLLARVPQDKPGSPNFEGVPTGITLYGASRGRTHTLDVLPDGYLCSDGHIYQSLSGAALAVSGNRRSGWVFWGNAEGKPLGEILNRHGVKERYASVSGVRD